MGIHILSIFVHSVDFFRVLIGREVLLSSVDFHAFSTSVSLFFFFGSLLSHVVFGENNHGKVRGAVFVFP